LGLVRTPSVLVVGEAITAFMRYPGETELSFHGPFPSGAPVIFASAAARLGVRVDLAAGVGADRFGVQLYDRLVRHGVSTNLVTIDPSRPAAATFVTYHDDGSRDFVFPRHSGPPSHGHGWPTRPARPAYAPGPTRDELVDVIRGAAPAA